MTIACIVIDTVLRHRNIRNIDSYSFLLLGFPRCSFKIFQLLNYLQIAYFILWLCISNINNLLYGDDSKVPMWPIKEAFSIVDCQVIAATKDEFIRPSLTLYIL
jgi:hypothetical protein